MSKKNEQVVTITHTEIIGLAIQRLADTVMKEEESAKRFEATDPGFAKDIREGSPWRKKLKMLMQMYKFETGRDYGFDYDIDLG